LSSVLFFLGEPNWALSLSLVGHLPFRWLLNIVWHCIFLWTVTNSPYICFVSWLFSFPPSSTL